MTVFALGLLPYTLYLELVLIPYALCTMLSLIDPITFLVYALDSDESEKLKAISA